MKFGATYDLIKMRALVFQVVFFCLVEPGEDCGGLTPLARNSEIFSELDPAIVRRLEERNIRYIRYLEDESEQPYASWQQSFMTHDRKVCWDTSCTRETLDNVRNTQ